MFCCMANATTCPSPEMVGLPSEFGSIFMVDLFVVPGFDGVLSGAEDARGDEARSGLGETSEIDGLASEAVKTLCREGFGPLTKTATMTIPPTRRAEQHARKRW